MNEVLQTIPFEGEVFVNFGIVKISKKFKRLFLEFYWWQSLNKIITISHRKGQVAFLSQ